MIDFTSHYDGGKLARACSQFVKSGEVCPACNKPALMFHIFDGEVVRYVCQECPTIVPTNKQHE